MAVRPAMLCAIWNDGTEKKTGGRAEGGRVEDVTIFFGSDQNKQDQKCLEMKYIYYYGCLSLLVHHYYL